MNSQYSGRTVAAMLLALGMLAGCKSKQDAAIDKAKQQAAATGQAQQVVSTDGNGNGVDDDGSAACSGADDAGSYDDSDAGRCCCGEYTRDCAGSDRTTGDSGTDGFFGSASGCACSE